MVVLGIFLTLFVCLLCTFLCLFQCVVYLFRRLDFERVKEYYIGHVWSRTVGVSLYDQCGGGGGGEG